MPSYFVDIQSLKIKKNFSVKASNQMTVSVDLRGPLDTFKYKPVRSGQCKYED